MGESGRRQRNKRERDGGSGDNKNQRRRGNERDDRSNNNRDNAELVVYRILCPDGFIGSVIGKSGKVINSIRQDSRAKIKIVDPFPGSKNRVITIYCYVKEKEDIEPDEEFGDFEPVCAAQDALLKVHNAIANVVGSAGDSDKKWKDKEECQILVPSSQSANIIGKAGATIKKLRSKTRANIKVTPKDVGDPAHSCAMDFDNFVQITGEPEAVKKALFAVSSIMYKFAPKEDIPLETSVPEAPPSIIIPSDVPIYPAAGLYPSVDSYVPSRSLPSVLGASHVPELQGYADTGNTWPIYSSALPVVSGYAGASLSGELIIRVLCPFNKIGRVIGRGGASIRSVREASGARVDVDDTRRDECIITISATESLDDIKSMAVEAVLLLQGKINEEDEENVSIRLLVPSKVIGCIIGKSGSIINEIRKRTKADVRISKGDKPKCADANDELVEVIGEVGSVRDALVQIVLRLRDDVLKDRDSSGNPSSGNDSMYAGGSGLQVPSVLPSVSSVAPLGYEHRAESGSSLGLLSSNYGYGSLPMSDNGYGSLSSYSSKLYGGLPPSASEMLIPAHAVGKVMGKGGANVDNIRKISGAAVEISDSKSFRGDRVALISGTPEQKRAAENLIQAFIMAT
ncbi:KH domain-containing protein At4g18375-like [Cynara cardunculus var. scolymus]|uniref:KH domain-containing protein At4g18375-like n=1 Tax=Cynara cardunculus var. scolymus TaxID=59895 RepID=UPI000D62894B|nr:KH domain-containing protein At4g18375-like [Cynara cardunculus var. scolymus]XP_024987710.1 KH domain-containing protein At4g18375-like [Cynara cardunculus var. scolymus]